MRQILIVDDNPQNLYMLQTLLCGHGYTVVTAAHGAEALEKARIGSPDMVIADILMPVMDGFQLCREWVGDSVLKDVPFVFYTATYTDPKDEKLALGLGAERFVVKPQQPEVLLSILDEVFAAHRPGRGVAPEKPQPDETIFYREYNEALIRKLEDKMVKVEEANRCLELEVAERVRTEEELRLTNERLRRFGDANIVGIIVTTAAGEMLEANDYYLRMIGSTREDLVHGRINWRSITPPESLPADERAIQELRERGVSEPYEKEYVRPDGVRVSAFLANTMLPGPGGKIAAFVLDITERKREEAERTRLSAAIEQAGEIVIVTDPAGTIQYVNPAFETVTGYTREEAVGRNPRLLQSGKHDPEFYSALWEKISSGKTWTGRIVNRRKDGRIYTEDATISPVLDASGRVVNYVAVNRDITEHLHLAEQYQQAQKMESIGRLAGGVAHDVNNALTPLLAISGILLKDLGPGHPLYEDIEEMQKAGVRCVNLTRQLLAFSRSQPLELKCLNLNDVVADMAKMLCRVIGEGVELVTFLDPELGDTKADVGQMEQVIANLAINARDAMPDGGKLTFETKNVTLDEAYADGHVATAPGHYVMLAVSDTGGGMDADTRAHMFEPFFTTKEKGKGTGLGLSTVYGIIKQSGGNLWVYSEPGQGSTFKVYLPRIGEDAKESGPGALGPQESYRGSETILLVEDEEAVRKVAGRVLRNCGYTVVEADSGEEALKVSANYGEPIHLVIADVVMPGMSGRETADRLLVARPGIKVLFTSGYTANAIVQRGSLDRTVSFVSKPFTVETLTAKVRQVLESC